MLVIHHLLTGTRRFGELSRLLGGVSARTLTRQFRELEESGIIHRRVYQQIPPRVDYSLTELGRELEPVLMAMHSWGQRLESNRQRISTRRKKSSQNKTRKTG